MKRRAFTLIELLVVISIIALLVGILLPALGAARKTARQIKSNTQLRSIHQTLVMFARQNNGYYPGHDEDGVYDKARAASKVQMSTAELDTAFGGSAPANAGVDTGVRYTQLMSDGYFTSELAISPEELSEKTRWSNVGTLATTQNFSYNMLDLSYSVTSGSAEADREWQETSNAEAPIMSDRLKLREGGTLTNYDDYISIYVANDAPGWEGGVMWNDGHANWERDHIMNVTRFDGEAWVEGDVVDSLFVAGDIGADDDPSTALPADGENDNAFLVYGQNNLPHQ